MTTYKALLESVGGGWFILRLDPYAIIGWDDFGGQMTEMEAKAFAFTMNAILKGKPVTYIDYWANDGSSPDLVYYDGPIP